jgi:hypothetical protein
VNTTLTPNTPLGYSLASIPLAYSRGYTLQDQLWPFAPTRYNLQLTRITSVSRQRFSFPLNLLLGSRCQFPAPSNSPTRPVSHTRTRQRCGFQSLALANKYSKLPNLCPSYMPISSLRCPEPKLYASHAKNLHFRDAQLAHTHFAHSHLTNPWHNILYVELAVYLTVAEHDQLNRSGELASRSSVHTASSKSRHCPTPAKFRVPRTSFTHL